MSDYPGKEVFKLGFGLMRLPKTTDGKNDVAETSAMVDRFIAAGGTYFDTAYVYDNGDSEAVIKKALVERYPRDSYTLCSKLNAGLPGLDEESAKKEFYTSLERTGAGYFDYYLLHALQRSNYKKYDEFGIWDYVKGLRDKGLVKHWGFSFHGDPALLEELLRKHPDVDFIQLQINYADWDNPGVASGECYRIARAHGKSVTVMEPVKGGYLADPPEGVKKLFKEASPDASFASWGIRYAASLDGIITVLSGMSNIAQMEDNLSYMKDFRPLTQQEQAVIQKAREELRKDNSIQCTACHYCTEGCPMDIAIPEIFAVKNCDALHERWKSKGEYTVATQGRGKASDCIECGQCEAACPQHLEIISLLKQCIELEPRKK